MTGHDWWPAQAMKLPAAWHNDLAKNAGLCFPVDGDATAIVAAVTDEAEL